MAIFSTEWDEERLAAWLPEAYAMCASVGNTEASDITELLDYQKELMALLPRSASAMAFTQRLMNMRKGQMATKYTSFKWNMAKELIESDCADEISAYMACERLNRTITHLLDALNVRIPAERRLMPNQR